MTYIGFHSGWCLNQTKGWDRVEEPVISLGASLSMPTPPPQTSCSIHISLNESPSGVIPIENSAPFVWHPHCILSLADSQRVGAGRRREGMPQPWVLTSTGTACDERWVKGAPEVLCHLGEPGNWRCKSQTPVVFWTEEILRPAPLQTLPYFKPSQQENVIIPFLPCTYWPRASEIHSADFCILNQWQSPWHRPDDEWMDQHRWEEQTQKRGDDGLKPWHMSRVWMN